MQRSLVAHSNGLYDLAFSKDSRFLASTGGDAKTLVWNVTIGNIVAQLPTDGNPWSRVAFSPDGTRLCGGRFTGACRVWSIAGQSPLVNISGHTREILAIEWTSDGRILTLSPSDDPGTLRTYTPSGVLVDRLTQVRFANRLAVHPLTGQVIVIGENLLALRRLRPVTPPPTVGG